MLSQEHQEVTLDRGFCSSYHTISHWYIFGKGKRILLSSLKGEKAQLFTASSFACILPLLL